MVNKYNIISIFASCGGSSLGYKWAGFNELLAIDFDKNAVETFKLNFVDVPVWEKDICQVTVKEILGFCKIKKGKLDILDGSPPCQGFSTAGKRQVNDERNDLFKEFARLINGLQPKVFVMENVSGLIKGKMKGKFIEIMKTLKSLNYNVKCKLMNAKYYQVPQSRERLIWIGVRKDLGIEPSFPKPSNKVITVKEAFKNVINDNISFKYLKGDKAKLITKVKQGEQMSKLPIANGKYFNTLRLCWTKPSPTIPKLFGETWGSFFAHPETNRSITINELKRLSTFPDNYKFIGKFQEQWARIGNSVMPKFMQAIAENIKINILDKQNFLIKSNN